MIHALTPVFSRVYRLSSAGIICYTRPRSVRLTCGHGVLCETCWNSCQNPRGRSECPVCRQVAYQTFYYGSSQGPVAMGGTQSYVPPSR